MRKPILFVALFLIMSYSWALPTSNRIPARKLSDASCASTVLQKEDRYSAGIARPFLIRKGLVGDDHEIFAGVHANFNLPIIFNQNTHGVFGGRELAYKPTFGLAAGVRLGYTYLQHYGFETGFIFYSRQGQDYDDNLNGLAARRQVKLQYMQVPIVLRYKFKQQREKQISTPWVINVGAQVGFLQSAEITYDDNAFPLEEIPNEESDHKNYFKSLEAAFVLGLEKEIYFTKWFFMSVGVRTTISNDINAKDWPVVNDGKKYHKSHNFTFGFTLSVNTYFRK